MKSKHIARKKLPKSLLAIAARLAIVQRQAEKLGIFTESRDLLKCAKCGLMEDILCDGRLVAYCKGKKIDDTGLRFKHKRGTVYYCPICGLKADFC